MSLLTINYYKDFEENVLNKKDKFILVYFFAQWCGPCKIFSKRFEEFSDKNKNNQIETYKLDIDFLEVVAQEYGIMSIPTIIVFKDGEEIERYSGIIEDIDVWIERIIKTNL